MDSAMWATGTAAVVVVAAAAAEARWAVAAAVAEARLAVAVVVAEAHWAEAAAVAEAQWAVVAAVMEAHWAGLADSAAQKAVWLAAQLVAWPVGRLAGMAATAVAALCTAGSSLGNWQHARRLRGASVGRSHWSSPRRQRQSR